MGYTAGMVAAMLVLMAATPSARAQGGELDPPIPDAEEVIASCQTAYEKRMREDGRTTSDQIDISQELAICLENNIKENLGLLIHMGVLRRKDQTLDRMLETANDAIYEIYDHIYNNNKVCSVGCGTMWYSYPNMAVAEHYKSILRMVLKRRRYQELNEDWVEY